MDHQPQFDRLRRDSAAKLKHFTATAQRTQEYLKALPLPADTDAYRGLLSVRQTEYDACHEYLLAAQRLADFLKEQVQYIQ